MEYTQLLDLHLSQCEIFLNKAKNNSYSDTDKQTYQNTLFTLFDAIKASIPDPLDDSDLFVLQEQLNFIAKSLEFLMDSTLNTIPFEVVSCLNLAMEDWIETKSFIIVTSLNNDIDAYSFDEKLASEDYIYSSMQASYGITFNKRLVQINLPEILARDYFSSVILYHELGHFIDLYFGISKRMATEMIKYQPLEWTAIQPFFDFSQNQIHVEKLRNHLCEYFCDLFAAQYIGQTSNHYLKYLESKGANRTSYSHPSSENRLKIVNDFLDGTTNALGDKIKTYTKNITKQELIKRFKPISSDDFYNFLPLEIADSAELHGVFPYAWKIWLKGAESFKTNAGIAGDLPSKVIYKSLNNLIEKSIGNYFILKDWKEMSGR
ncbi:hypothetical protein FHW88_002514 [Mucilaginibacter sp. SG538B]|uniref:hypothetical protein n=1 Tax=Mucilaginibacter sp. SG538B TaxID=2587021 RepID=UPI00159D301D|nr:hypothetical protein [Mucilaginibacter sp. SG538B]NVM64186.1 hypothetical protein [Mucilaginibacter sp. SG538B]NVM64225.1 hypothetical protein [Mucilaginibacter sp. SG538B]